MDLFEGLAKRWMIGDRKGPEGKPSREAWRHPEDLVLLLDEWDTPREGWNPNLKPYLKAVAWLHDLIEDGRKEDGTQVTEQDLLDAGVDWSIVRDVVSLSQMPGEDKSVYLARLVKASWAARVVKCVDRICNLREGKDCFKEPRWARYVDETQRYILPLATNMPTFFIEELRKAIDARPVVTQESETATP
jgi:(p)ppGpp synthase/HD superfamily hydrolase